MRLRDLLEEDGDHLDLLHEVFTSHGYKHWSDDAKTRKYSAATSGKSVSPPEHHQVLNSLFDLGYRLHDSPAPGNMLLRHPDNPETTINIEHTHRKNGDKYSNLMARITK